MTTLSFRRFSIVVLTLAFALTGATLQAQTYTVLHNFAGTDGCCANYPSMMAQGEDGNIYGATTSGGTSGYGVIFKMTPAGTLTDLHSFNFTDGDGPQGGISLGLDGNFYGTTYQGAEGRGNGAPLLPGFD